MVQDLRFAARILSKSPGFSLLVVLTLGLGIGTNTAIFSIIDAVWFQAVPYVDADRFVMVWNRNDQYNQMSTSWPEFHDWEAEPGIFEQVTAIHFRRVRMTYGLRVFGRSGPPNGQVPQVDYRRVTPGYFEAMRIPILHGRTFTDEGRAGTPDVVVVNDLAARQLWPGEDAIGKRVTLGTEPLTVIGVVGSVRHMGLDREPSPEMYRAWLQDPVGSLTFVARSTGSFRDLLSTLRGPTAIFVQAARIGEVRTLDEYVMRSVREPRFRMLLFALLAALVLVVTIVGAAGLTAHAVAARTREIGIRMAIGAQRGQVLRMILRRSAAPVAAGTTVGLVVSYWATRALESFLFEVRVDDPLSYAVGAMLLLSTPLVAAYFPALLATRVDPATTLRHE
jgi:hypothetical protein